MPRFFPAYYGNPAAMGGASFVGPLDGYSTSLSVALLPFRAFSSYVGNAFRIRDTTGDAEQEVGFNASTGALASYTVAGNAAVRKWYDQSGVNDVSQATAAVQPYLTLNVVNGQPVVRFDGSNDYLTGNCTNNQGRTTYMVAKMRSSAANARLSNDGSNAGSVYDSGASTYRYYATSHINDPVGGTSTNWNLIVLKYSGGSTCAPYINNSAGTAFSTGLYYIYGGTYWLASDVGGSSCGPVDIACRLQYDVVHDDTTRQAIQTILAAKFGITLS